MLMRNGIAGLAVTALLAGICLGASDDGFTDGRTLGHSSPDEVGMCEKQLSKLDLVVADAIIRGDMPGAVLLVARQGKVVYRKGFGARATEPEYEAMTLDTVFDMASLTKVMATATAVMMLVEDGRISLTDAVSRYLPGFAQNEKAGVTILQLLTHFSGLRPSLNLQDPWTGCDAGLGRAYQETPVAAPHDRFLYSDINYIVLAELVRSVSGMRLDEFAEERIFGPLGMRDTTFSAEGELLCRTAPTESRDGKLLRGEVHDPTAARMPGCAGHAGVFSTADDTAIFAQTILNGGTFNGVRILSPLAVYQMTGLQSPPQSLDWRGIGFDIRTAYSTNRGDLFPVGSFGHTGFTGTSLWVDPYTETFVVLLSSRLHPAGAGNVVSLRKKVASVVAASIIDVPAFGEPVRRN
jgi:CubicO group peptidase (beta-lactamase class C family)